MEQQKCNSKNYPYSRVIKSLVIMDNDLMTKEIKENCYIEFNHNCIWIDKDNRTWNYNYNSIKFSATIDQTFLIVIERPVKLNL